MKTDKPVKNSGKTYFNRIKSKEQSWIELRDEAVRAGTWHHNRKESANYVDRKE
ncbi:MAG: hypothetical protein WC373_04750 [Smithella sp.]|jgi:hypothetical protein